MPALLGSEGVPQPNLFTPGFGQAPHFCVGRDQMLAEIRSALNVGPEDDRFTSVLLGPRGSGKTVALGMIEDVAVEAGWVVFSLDASTDGIHGRIKEQIAWAQDQYEGLPPTDAPDRRTTTRARLRIWPVSFQREVAESVRIKWGLRRQLTTLAAHAAAQGTAVMLSVDEMHGGDRDEMRRLSADLQHIVKRAKLPVAFIGAGLSDMKHTLLEDKKMTFFHRGGKFDMPPLTPSDSMRFFRKTITDAGGAFEDTALRALADAAGGLPYRMQLLGYHAWVISGAPFHPVDDHAAREAVFETDRVMADRVHVPMWHDLGDAERSYLRAMASGDGTTRPSDIAAQMDQPPTTLADIERRLRNIGCIDVRPDGSVGFGDLMRPDVVLGIMASESRYAIGGRPVPPERSSGSALVRCNAVMPRAKARCILRAEHPGRHRSR